MKFARAASAFPAEQAGQLIRSIQLPDKPAKEPEVEYLVTSRSSGAMNAEQMLSFDRKYWGIESRLHQRRNCIAGEDRSRVRGNAALNLAVIRRAVVSIAPTGSAIAKTNAGRQ